MRLLPLHASLGLCLSGVIRILRPKDCSYLGGQSGPYPRVVWRAGQHLEVVRHQLEHGERARLARGRDQVRRVQRGVWTCCHWQLGLDGNSAIGES